MHTMADPPIHDNTLPSAWDPLGRSTRPTPMDGEDLNDSNDGKCIVSSNEVTNPRAYCAWLAARSQPEFAGLLRRLCGGSPHPPDPQGGPPLAPLQRLGIDPEDARHHAGPRIPVPPPRFEPPAPRQRFGFDPENARQHAGPRIPGPSPRFEP